MQVVLVVDAGGTQLCAEPAAALIGGVLPARIPCEEDGEVVCQDSVVVRCERAPRLLATCTHGCAALELPADVEDRAAVMLSCAR